MNTEPLSVAGVAGPIVIATKALWGHPAVSVAGVPAPRTGRRYALPAVDGGVVQATLRTPFADPYPTMEINGVQHRTGPPVPVFLRILAPLPILLLIVGGVLGGLIGALGFLANLTVARTRMAPAVKALAMVGVGIVTAMVWLVIAVALNAATS
ncbi:hypothetical protein LADH09A_005761 [Micromonospora sp. LAH09]|uniref:hypothetical protein n=1 Tax=Micromonospora cabrerizensis TaxID=2911213 RepID=UPI001EE98181|nr:hypothetical protein [Micromonospora cabrerizensis]MCG5471759.1 hypothetical protein [Micromonospora cabrerizensis]